MKKDAEIVSTRRDPAELAEQARELGPWFHNLHLPGGVQTAPDHFLGDFPRFKWRELAPHLPTDLTGWSVLDIGCNAGFYSFELARRGANVLGIDHDEHYLKQARWARDVVGLGERVELQLMPVYDLARLERRFDLVLFMGVFYHLRYPLLGLDIVARRVKRMLVFQTLTMPGERVAQTPLDSEINDRGAMAKEGWPKMAFIEHRLAGDPTNWWAANHAAVLALLRSTGFRVTAQPAHELYLAVPDASRFEEARRELAPELHAATGQPAPSDG